MTVPEGGRHEHGGANSLTAFLAYLAEIEQSVFNRNWSQLAASLRKRRASHLPREVREELALLARSSRASMRAPVQFLRFQYRMTQLAVAGDPMPMAQTELDLGTVPNHFGRVTTPGQRVAARDDTTDDPDRS